MPTYEFGNMWDAYGECDLFCITTNSTLTNDDRLIMGGGIAREALDRFPGIDLACGAAIKEYGTHYGMVVLDLLRISNPKLRINIINARPTWHLRQPE